MAYPGETFFTSIGCMDGRVQEIVAKYGKQKLAAIFPDTITEAGLDGLLASTSDQTLLDSIKNKVFISVEKHHSQAIVIHGHEDCAGNPVSKDQHINHIKASVEKIKQMLNGKEIPVLGLYVTLYPDVKVEEV